MSGGIPGPYETDLQKLFKANPIMGAMSMGTLPVAQKAWGGLGNMTDLMLSKDKRTLGQRVQQNVGPTTNRVVQDLAPATQAAALIPTSIADAPLDVRTYAKIPAVLAGAGHPSERGEAQLKNTMPPGIPRDTNWEAPIRTPMPEIAPVPHAELSAPAVAPTPLPVAPQYDPRAENAVNRLMGQSDDLALQGRSDRNMMRSRLENLDVSGKSAPFLAPGVINAGLQLGNENATATEAHAGRKVSAMPSIVNAVQEGNKLPYEHKALEMKSMFENASPKTQAEIAQMQAHANYYGSEKAKNAPLEVIAKLQQEALAGLPPAERAKYGLATLPNHTPKDSGKEDEMIAKSFESYLMNPEQFRQNAPQLAAFFESKYGKPTK